ncbi:MAG: YXWGXW repeat-containing protein [Myxococcota bacterium]
MVRQVIRAAMVMLASALLVLGCMSSTGRQYLEDQARTTERPPEPMEEAIPEPPEEGMVWTGGYWYRADDRFVWVPGRWEHPPVPGHVWVRAGWLEDDDAYRFAPGYWASPSHEPGHEFTWKWLPAMRGPNERVIHPTLRPGH